jgi:cytochrome P450
MVMSTNGACPADVHFDPLGPNYIADPYRIFSKLREESPVFYAPEFDTWVVVRARDIEAIFLDPVAYSSSNTQDRAFRLSEQAQRVLKEGNFPVPPTMVNADSPTHERIRKVNMRALSPRRIATMRPLVQTAAEQLVGAMLEKDHFDLVADLSFPLPALMIFTLLGFPPEDTELLKSWSRNRISFTWGTPSPDEQAEIAAHVVKYWKYCQQFVARRRNDLRDDYTSELWRVHLEDPDTVSPAEISSIVYGLSFAGHETTTNLTTNVVRRVLEDRKIWSALCADQSLIKNAVEECLRYDNSLISWRRRTTREVEIGGVRIPANSKLLLLVGAANRDPERFTEPETFDIQRSDSARHFSFGKGIHFCMGAPLARMEATIVLELLTQLAPDLELVPDQSLTFPVNVSFRGPTELWLLRGPAYEVAKAI